MGHEGTALAVFALSVVIGVIVFAYVLRVL
jgi:hypothetical protein